MNYELRRRDENMAEDIEAGKSEIQNDGTCSMMLNARYGEDENAKRSTLKS
jgi:hypothetical protein